MFAGIFITFFPVILPLAAVSVLMYIAALRTEQKKYIPLFIKISILVFVLSAVIFLLSAERQHEFYWLEILLAFLLPFVVGLLTFIALLSPVIAFWHLKSQKPPARRLVFFAFLILLCLSSVFFLCLIFWQTIVLRYFSAVLSSIVERLTRALHLF